MSRQLSRIRSIISEIEEIQKQGQAEGKAQLHHRPQAPTAALPTVSAPDVEAIAQILEFKATVAPTPAPAAPTPQVEEVKPGKIAIQLTGNIVVALQIENTDEVVEIRQVQNSIEIRFADGKAVHLPLKNVA